MTTEQKRAVQTLLLEELRQQSESAPTLLFDVLVSGQGYQWVHHVVNLQHGRHAQLAQVTAGLLEALKAPTPKPDEEAA